MWENEMADSLDDILSDAPETPAAPAAPAQKPDIPTEKPETEAKPPREPSNKQKHRDKEQDAQGRVRDPETGQYVAKTEEPPAKVEPAAAPAPAAPAAAPVPVKPEMTAQERAYLAAAQDERRKRQEIEAKLKAYEAKPAEPAKQFWDDPEGALKAMEQRTQEAIAQTRIQTSETIARSRYTDFDEKIGIFREIATQNPYMGAQCMSSPDPAEYAYKLGKNHMELQQAGGLDALRTKIETETKARVRTEIEAELKARAEAAQAERAAIPGSLSDARSSGVNRPVWGGAPSMDEILKG